MKEFYIFQHGNSDQFVAVKKGLSWPAFFFSWIWAFSKRLYALGFSLLAMIIFSRYLSYFLDIVYPHTDDTNMIIKIMIIGTKFFPVILAIECLISGNRYYSSLLWHHNNGALVACIMARSNNEALQVFQNKKKVKEEVKRTIAELQQMVDIIGKLSSPLLMKIHNQLGELNDCRFDFDNLKKFFMMAISSVPDEAQSTGIKEYVDQTTDKFDKLIDQEDKFDSIWRNYGYTRDESRGGTKEFYKDYVATLWSLLFFLFPAIIFWIVYLIYMIGKYFTAV